jgi:succinate dehydrogenase/fumarate reductase cytochrome b subunit
MAGNTQIDPKTEGGLFSLIHGLTGFFIAVALLLSILAFLTINAIAVQQANAEKYYEVNQDLHGLKMLSPDNHKQWINK